MYACYVIFMITSIQQEHTSYHARVILCLAQEGFAPKDLITLPVGISLLVQDCVTNCQHTPPTNWPVAAYDIIGREDIVKSLQPSSQDTAAAAGRMQLSVMIVIYCVYLHRNAKLEQFMYICDKEIHYLTTYL